MIARVTHFFRRLRRAMSRSEGAIRLLGLPVSEGTATEPGLVLIQIDGLSRKQLEAALARGRLPFLRRLQRREHYRLRTFYSGIPSTTPAVQGELYYGVRCAVPAFSFCDPVTQEKVLMFHPDCAKRIEAGLQKHCEGLLHGGSSWFNIYTGGAASEETHFCSATLGPGDVFRSRPILRLLTFPLFHFPSLLKLVTLLVVEFFIAVWDMGHGLSRGERLWEELTLVFKRVIVSIALRELVTIGVKIDVARGLPIIHANFLGYDEQSHRRGPGSAFAHWSLTGIDRAIRSIYRAAERSARRDYQLWLFSDHGQETTRFFDDVVGQTLERTINAALESSSNLQSLKPGKSQGNGHRADSPMEEASLPESTLADQPIPEADQFGGARNLRSKAAWFRLEGGVQTEALPFTLAAVGPVGHLHFKRKYTSDERREVAELLVREGHVPGVLVHDDSGIVEWIHSRGRTVLPDEIPDFLPHPAGLKAELSRDLVELCTHPLAGDLILLGWRPEGPRLSFANERGAHAGPGMEETQGFVFAPELTRWPDPDCEFVRPAGLRAAALHFLGRQPLPARPPIRRCVTQNLRVMTYNVHGCFGLDGRVSPFRIARVIERYNPDLVALQELDLGRVRSRRHDQPRLIAEALGMNVCFSPTVIRDDEQYGHALLAHFPMELVRKDILSAGQRARNVEPRGALWVRAVIDGFLLNLLNTHFGLNRYERFAQATDLLDRNWLGGIGPEEPVILCGDFNMFPRSRPYRELTRRLRDVQVGVNGLSALNTFSSLRPLVRIDHIFVSPHFVPKHFQVPRNYLTCVASDHLPLIVDLVFQEGALRSCSPLPSAASAGEPPDAPPPPARPHTLPGR
jgi:endonuclease/exonuclease/phosphatase family metal-dependent hydrolase